MGSLITTLDSNFVALFADGAKRLLGRKLPGDAACAILPNARVGVLRLVYDPNKTDVMLLLRVMLQNLYESYAEPVVFPDGSIELVNRPFPTTPEKPVEFTST